MQLQRWGGKVPDVNTSYFQSKIWGENKSLKLYTAVSTLKRCTSHTQYFYTGNKKGNQQMVTPHC